MVRTLMTLGEVAGTLRKSRDWFYRHRRILEQVHGFPRPVRGTGWRWDPLEIEQWLDRMGPAKGQDGPNQTAA
jgi:predicted DNA-binding transcriptional regulator AlpA